MKDNELASIILHGLHNSTNATGLDKPLLIAQTHGVNDRGQIDRVCDDLAESGKITDYWKGDTIIARISAAGIKAIQPADEDQ